MRIEWEEDSAVDIERACRAFIVQGFKGLRLDGAEGERTDRAEEPGVYKD